MSGSENPGRSSTAEHDPDLIQLDHCRLINRIGHQRTFRDVGFRSNRTSWLTCNNFRYRKDLWDALLPLHPNRGSKVRPLQIKNTMQVAR